MAEHDPHAWRGLDMPRIRQRMQEPDSILQLTSPDDDGTFLIPLSNRRKYRCGHYFTLFEMLMNEHTPMPEQHLVTRVCTTCNMRAIVEHSEDSSIANYSDA